MKLPLDLVLVILDKPREQGGELHCKGYHIHKFGDVIPRHRAKRRRIVRSGMPLTIAIRHQGVAIVIHNINGEPRIVGM